MTLATSKPVVVGVPHSSTVQAVLLDGRVVGHVVWHPMHFRYYAIDYANREIAAADAPDAYDDATAADAVVAAWEGRAS